MFQFVAGITFVLYKHPTESTGGYRASGIRKSGGRGPGLGGSALFHAIGLVDGQATGASQAILGRAIGISYRQQRRFYQLRVVGHMFDHYNAHRSCRKPRAPRQARAAISTRNVDRLAVGGDPQAERHQDQAEGKDRNPRAPASSPIPAKVHRLFPRGSCHLEAGRWIDDCPPR